LRFAVTPKTDPAATGSVWEPLFGVELEKRRLIGREQDGAPGF
jgi:hypothetical protein